MLFQPCRQRSAPARNPLTGAISPTYIGLMVAGGIRCTEITAQPCRITHVTQNDGRYLEDGGEGFHERFLFGSIHDSAWRMR
jgi:hypothetical protein